MIAVGANPVCRQGTAEGRLSLPTPTFADAPLGLELVPLGQDGVPLVPVYGDVEHGAVEGRRLTLIGRRLLRLGLAETAERCQTRGGATVINPPRSRCDTTAGHQSVRDYRTAAPGTGSRGNVLKWFQIITN